MRRRADDGARQPRGARLLRARRGVRALRRRRLRAGGHRSARRRRPPGTDRGRGPSPRAGITASGAASATFRTCCNDPAPADRRAAKRIAFSVARSRCCSPGPGREHRRCRTRGEPPRARRSAHAQPCSRSRRCDGRATRAARPLGGSCTARLEVSPSYVPAATNLAALASATNDRDLVGRVRCEVDRRAARPRWVDLDGPTLPFGYAARAIDRSMALQAAVRTGDPGVFALTLVD